MLVVGLTGGIGCGKSIVSDFFHNDFNIPIIDADSIVKDLTDSETVIDKIYEKLGKQYINAQGKLKREKLRKAIFSDQNLRKTLENILHPLVYIEIEKKLKSLNTNYCIVVIPLLIETDKKNFIDRVLVVDCTVEQQIERVVKRDQCSEEHVRNIIATQVDRNDRLKFADDVIENTGNRDSLHEKIAILHKKYKQLSSTKIESE